MSVAALNKALASVPVGSERADVLASARQFKSNWVELGERLSRVMNDRLFEQWGFASFDAYVTGELRLKRDTAYKLVRSYTFVRTSKPEYLTAEKAPPMEVVDFISRKREAEALPPRELEAFAEQAFEHNWTPRTISQKWRDLVSDDRATAAPEDKSTRAVRRARELAERLSKTLLEIPGLDPSAVDAAQQILAALPE